MKRVTAADVASAAGVSRTTVSYVLNDAPNQAIPEQTRRRVFEAAERLGYNPSAAARALVRGRSDVVIFVVPSEVSVAQWGRRVLDRMSRRFADEGFTLLAHTGHFGQPRVDAVWRTITPAAVLCIAVEPDQVAAMHAAGVPLVLPLYGGGDAIEQITVASERAVIESQLATLVEAGHRRIAFVFAESGHRLAARARRVMLPDLAASLGLESPTHFALADAPEDAAGQLRELVDSGFTAVCAVNDHVAGIVLAAARHAGLVVPDDVAVIGAGDEVMSAVTEPPLTTVVSDADSLAAGVIAVVTARINQRPVPRDLPMPDVAVIRRGSV